MNGTGTQSDPYQVTTADEFVTAVGGGGNYVKLMNDIDFNEGNYYNITSPIPINCKELDGQGYKLDNILSKFICHLFSITDNNIEPKVTIKNIIFEILGLACFSNSKTNALFYISPGSQTDGVTFLNCDFRIKCKYRSTVGDIFCSKSSKISKMIFQNCIFNIEMIPSLSYNAKINILFNDLSDGIGMTSISLYDCMIDINIINAYGILNIILNKTQSNYGSQFIIENTGIFINNSNSSSLISFCDNIFSSTSMKIYNSYFIYSGNQSFKLDGEYFASLCFYDSDKANGKVVVTNSNIIPLTTEQCKDAAYLESIGFVVST